MVVDLSAHLPLMRLNEAHAEHDDEGEHDEDEHHEGNEHDGDEDGESDPHVWMDPTLVAGLAVEIAEVLAEVDPAHEAEYAGRASELVA